MDFIDMILLFLIVIFSIVLGLITGVWFTRKAFYKFYCGTLKVSNKYGIENYLFEIKDFDKLLKSKLILLKVQKED